MNDKHTLKKQIRKELKEKRNSIPEKYIFEESIKICKQICATPEFQKAKTVFCYISFENEIDTFYILDKCFKTGKTLCVPKVIGTDMVASRITDMDNLIENEHGIEEPRIADEIKRDQIDLIIVPALGFNKKNYRIGYGLGFYDKYLKGYMGTTFGMVLKDSIVDADFQEEFDFKIGKIFIQE